LALAEAFIQGDEVSSIAQTIPGRHGEAIRAACVLWLKAASRKSCERLA
jgi:hypothetical protein